MALHADLTLVINTVRAEIANSDAKGSSTLSGIVEEYLAMMSTFIEPSRTFERSLAKILAATWDLQTSLARLGAAETSLTAAVRATALRTVDAFETVATASKPSAKAIRLNMSWESDALPPAGVIRA